MDLDRLVSQDNAFKHAIINAVMGTDNAMEMDSRYVMITMETIVMNGVK